MVVPAVGCFFNSCARFFAGFCRFVDNFCSFCPGNWRFNGARTLGLAAGHVRYAVAMTLRIRCAPARSALVFIALSLAACLGGCGRASITFTLNPQPLRLEETTVMGDPGAASKVALVDVRGVIVDARQRGLLTPASNPVDELVARLEKARHDPAVKAVVLRVNSPGGSVTASDIMYREVRRFRTETGKPVVVSMGEIAASGGYYLALAGDAIVAQPTTITGSVGVIIPTVNFSQGLNRIGIVSRSIKSGENKDLANPLEPMREGQYAVLQHMVDDFYARFRSLVLSRRAVVGEPGDARVETAPQWLESLHPRREQVNQARATLASRANELLDGRVVSGEEAAALGLVDAAGDLRDAFELAVNSVPGGGKCRLVKYHDEGDSVRSAYAMSGDALSAESPGQAGGQEINLIQLRMGGEGLPGVATGGPAWYLWTLP